MEANTLASKPPLRYVSYENEDQMHMMMRLIEKDLSEPYSIYTYRYFLLNWPKLAVLCYSEDKLVGCVISKMERHKSGNIWRGYIAMLAVDAAFRKQSIGSELVMKSIEAMKQANCDEVVLETEVSNSAALALYMRLGFLKQKRLQRYYLNGGDAFRLKARLKGPPQQQQQ